jgi:septum formation protein
MLVLASASPRRQELLRNAGISFEVCPADIPEIPMNGEVPIAFAKRVATEKALKVWRLRPGDFVLGADTIVVVNGEILGKPIDAADASRMLRLLSGREHEVTTAVCLIPPAKVSPVDRELTNPDFVDVRSETTTVVMHAISQNDIADYVATGEPMDKAGAYAIQGGAAHWIPEIRGDYSNVVGLPVSLVQKMLHEHGVQ